MRSTETWSTTCRQQAVSSRGTIPSGTTVVPCCRSAERIDQASGRVPQLTAVDVYGADILEVGYSVRGNVDASTHLALWDTFSRNGRFLTGNGTSDDHAGKSWKGLGNGFLTATWGTSKADQDVVAALRSGRAFLYHCGRWPNAELDMLVDDVVPMGMASVSSVGSRNSQGVRPQPPVRADGSRLSGAGRLVGCGRPRRRGGPSAQCVVVRGRSGNGDRRHDSLELRPRHRAAE